MRKSVGKLWENLRGAVGKKVLHIFWGKSESFPLGCGKVLQADLHMV